MNIFWVLFTSLIQRSTTYGTFNYILTSHSVKWKDLVLHRDPKSNGVQQKNELQENRRDTKLYLHLLYLSMYIYLYIYIYLYLYLYLYIYIFIYIPIYIYNMYIIYIYKIYIYNIYIYNIYTYIYTYIHTYTPIYTSVSAQSLMILIKSLSWETENSWL